MSAKQSPASTKKASTAQQPNKTLVTSLKPESRNPPTGTTKTVSAEVAKSRNNPPSTSQEKKGGEESSEKVKPSGREAVSFQHFWITEGPFTFLFDKSNESFQLVFANSFWFTLD